MTPWSLSVTTSNLPAATLPDPGGSRAELAEVFRRLRERVAAPDPDAGGGAVRPQLVLDPVTRPRTSTTEDLARITLGTADVAQVTGLVATTGLLLWAARSGGLTFALLASVPIWRNLDPLYVLPANPVHGTVVDGVEDDDVLPPVLPAAWRAAGRVVMMTDTDFG